MYSFDTIAPIGLVTRLVRCEKGAACLNFDLGLMDSHDRRGQHTRLERCLFACLFQHSWQLSSSSMRNVQKTSLLYARLESVYPTGGKGRCTMRHTLRFTKREQVTEQRGYCPFLLSARTAMPVVLTKTENAQDSANYLTSWHDIMTSCIITLRHIHQMTYIHGDRCL